MAKGETFQLQRVHDQACGEGRLYGYFAGRAEKESAITRRFAERFEAGLQKIAEGLGKPRVKKRLAKLHEHLGRFKEQYRGAGQHHANELVSDKATRAEPEALAIYQALNMDPPLEELSRCSVNPPYPPMTSMWRHSSFFDW